MTHVSKNARPKKKTQIPQNNEAKKHERIKKNNKLVPRKGIQHLACSILFRDREKLSQSTRRQTRQRTMHAELQVIGVLQTIIVYGTLLQTLLSINHTWVDVETMRERKMN